MIASFYDTVVTVVGTAVVAYAIGYAIGFTTTKAVVKVSDMLTARRLQRDLADCRADFGDSGYAG